MSSLTDADRAHIRALFPRARLLDIAREIAAELEMDAAEIMGTSRCADAVQARQMVMAVAQRDGLSGAAIARALGVDTGTVRHGIAAHARRVAELEAKAFEAGVTG